MKTLVLVRNYFDHGVFSGLYDHDEGVKLCVTVERPWLDNRKNVSCVPEGDYIMHPHVSPKFGMCYALEHKDDSSIVSIHGPSERTHILLHKANRVCELQGCIAPGMDFGVIKGDWAVTSSGVALDRVMKYLGNQKARLIIASMGSPLDS